MELAVAVSGSATWPCLFDDRVSGVREEGMQVSHRSSEDLVDEVRGTSSGGPKGRRNKHGSTSDT